MAEFILKDWHNKEKTFNHDRIFVKGTDGELIQFTEGTGDAPAVVQPLEVTENGTYTTPDGVDGFNQVTVNVDTTWAVILPKEEVSGFVLDSTFGAFSPGYVYPANFTLETEKTYKVSWDNVDYECVAFAITLDPNQQIFGIGNASSLGLQGNNEPFLIIYNKTYDNTQLFSTDTKESHAVGIYQSAIKEIVLQDKTITENGEYTADEGFDGLGKVLVEIASSGSETKFKIASFTANGTWNENVTINFGFKPDFLFVFAGSGTSSVVSIGTSNFLFKGGSQKWKDMFGNASLNYYYVSSNKIYAGRGSFDYVIDSTDANCPINNANENGFNFGVTHASGSYGVFAIGL